MGSFVGNRVKAMSHQDIIHDGFPYSLFPKEYWEQLIVRLADEIMVDDYVAPMFVVPRVVSNALEEAGNVVDTGLQNYLKVDCASFQGLLPLLTPTHGDEDYITMIAIKRSVAQGLAKRPSIE